jgi:oxygen-dependent protoporphyrinogen oxidase
VRRLVVVGGGISGLAAAWKARQVLPPGELEIVVLEADDEVGGKARSLRVGDGYLVEGGPQGFLNNEPVLDELMQSAGLGEERIEADQSAARRFVLRRGKAREVAMNPLRFATSGLLGPTGLVRIALEPFVPRRRAPKGSDEATSYRAGMDESVWQFAARRLGKQAADRLISPMVLGIFAGNARSLSLESAFPKLHALEQNHGSLIRGALAIRRERKEKMSVGPPGALTSFRSGVQTLPRAVAAAVDCDVRCGTRVARVEPRAEGGYRLALAGASEPLDADAVILAIEPWSMADVLRPALPEVAHDLDGIEAPPVAVVALGYKLGSVKGIPRGFGVLVPRGEGIAMLGCLWESYVFPERSPDGTLLVRAMYGGSVDPESGRLTPAELVDLTRRELRRLFAVRDEPLVEKVVQWERAIPQYELGHAPRVRRIETALAGLPGLFLAGNGLYGVSFARAAAVGAEQGRAAARWLRAAARGASTNGCSPST